MRVSSLHKGSVAIMLAALIGFQILHLYSAWQDSHTAIVTADYAVPSNLSAGLHAASQQLEETMANRLVADNQLAGRYRMGVWLLYDQNMIRATFALRNSPYEQTLNRLGADFQKVILASQPPVPLTPPAGSVSSVTLMSMASHLGPSIKPLDVLSLAVLIAALVLWLRNDSEVRAH